MALVLSDRVKETTTTSGTGSITLGGAVGGFVTFASAIGDGNKTYYVIENDTRWEIGVGTYSSGSLSRDSVLASSIGGGKISLSGVSFVFVSLPASKTNIWNEESGDVNLPATLTLPQVIAHKVTVSGDILSSGLTNFVRTTSGNFFHAYVNDSNKRTLALYTDAASSPQWKLGLKSNPNDVNTPPNYAYIYAEDGDIGLYANSQNYLSLTHGGGFSIVNKSDSIFTSASTTGTSIIGNTAAYPSLIVKAAPAQAADIQQWKNSADSTLVKIENDGSLVVGGSDIATDIRTNSASGVAISGWSNSTLTSVSGYFEAGGAVSGYFQHVTDNIPDATQVSGSLQPQITNNLTSGNINRDYTGSVSGWADTTITQRDNNVSGWVKTHVANQVDQTAIDSGNSNLARISTNITNIALNASGVISSGNLNHSLIGSVSGFYNYKVDTSGNILLTRMISSGNTNKDYTASVSGWAASSFTGGGGSANSGDVLANSASGVAISGYNQSYTDIKVADLVDSAPATLNTLNEIATALSGDASLAVTLTNKINSSGNKVYDTAVAASLPVGSGAKIQANASSITSNTTAINASGNAVRDLAIASGNKAYDTSVAVSLPVGSGAKIQANAASITSNTSLVNSSGNKAYDTAVAASLPVGSGAKIQANEVNLIASGNKAYDTAVAASLPAGSGAKIQVNAANITSNTNLVNSSGNKAYDTAVAASLAIGSGAKIQVNTSNITANTTAINASGNSNRDYTAAVSGWADTTFTGGGGLAVESGAKIQANTANITSNTNLAIASGNKAYDTAIAASLAVGSGSKIQVNAANITSNTNLAIASGNKAYDTAIAVALTYAISSGNRALEVASGLAGDGGGGLALASGAKIQANTASITSNTNLINASGNKAYDTAIAVSLAVGSGAKIQANELALIASGNKAYDTAIAASLPVGSGSKIQTNSSNITSNTNLAIASGNKAYDTSIAVALTYAINSGNKAQQEAINLAIASGQRAVQVASGLASSAGGASSLDDLSDVLIENNSIFLGNDPSSSTSTAQYNIGFGTTALEDITTGDKNVAIGYNASKDVTTGHSTIAIGYQANVGATDYQYGNVIIGTDAGESTSSHDNRLNSVYIGTNAGKLSCTQDSVLIGNGAGQYIGDASNTEVAVVAIGASAMGGSSSDITDNYGSVGIGYRAGKDKGRGTPARYSIYVGYEAGYGDSDHANNMLYIANDEPSTTGAGGTIIKSDMEEKHLAIGQADLLVNAAGSGCLQIYAKDPADASLFIEPPIGSEGDLILAASGSHTLLQVDHRGTVHASGLSVSGVYLGDYVPTSTSNALYNDGGTLKFNGSAVGGGGGLAVGSGAKIQANAANITSNTNLVNSSGNKAYDTAVAASLPVGSGAKIQANVGNISTNATDLIASGNKAHDTAVAASLPVGSGSKIQVNAGNITSNTNLINSSGNKAYDTAVADSLAVGSGAKIQANELGLIASGNKAYDTAIAASLPVGSGAKIQANTANISTNATDLIASGNKAHDTATAASLPLGSGAEIQARVPKIPGTTNAQDIGSSSKRFSRIWVAQQFNAVLADANYVGVQIKGHASQAANLQSWKNSSATELIAIGPDGGLVLPDNTPSSTTNKLYNNGGTLTFNGSAVGGGGGSFNNFTLTADGGSNQTIADGNTLDIAGGNGITTAVGATDTVTVNVDAAQTTITSLLATDIKIGEDDQTKIDFEDANQINFYADNVKKFEVKSDGLVASGCIRQLPNTHTQDNSLAGVVNIDCSTSNYHEVLMTEDAATINFTSVTAGQRVIVRFKQHSAHIDLNSSEGFNDVNVNGSNATIKWGGGVVPTLTESNNAVDVYGFIFESTVTNVMAFIIAQDVK